MWETESALQRLLALARSQLGVREEPMGTGNVEYNTAYYGRQVRGSWYAWCCVFQWWLFQQAGLGELFYGGGKTASCTQLYQFYKKKGQTVDKTALRPGDLVFFVFDGGKSGCMNHVGVCERVEPGYVTTIDGNTGGDEANGGTVARKRRSLRYVGGAARPAYDTAALSAPAAGAGDPMGPPQPTYPTVGADDLIGPSEKEEKMKVYEYVSEVPQWARASAQRAVRNGYVKMDERGAMALYEVNLQPLVWLDRAGLLDGPAREVE